MLLNNETFFLIYSTPHQHVNIIFDIYVALFLSPFSISVNKFEK